MGTELQPELSGCVSLTRGGGLAHVADFNDAVPPNIQERFDELIGKRQAETLTPDEYSELLALTEQVERFQAQRVECLAELARLRGIPLAALMEELGIQPAAYA